jgi:uncharacterized protein YegP (UPF0339 family)
MRYVSLACLLVAMLLVAGSAGPAAGQGKKDKVADKVADKEFGKATSAVFQVYRDTKKEFRFRLKTEPEGITLAISQRGYKDRANIIRAIEAIKRLAPRAKIEDVPDKK